MKGDRAPCCCADRQQDVRNAPSVRDHALQDSTGMDRRKRLPPAAREAAEPIHVKVRGQLRVRNRRGEPCPRCGSTIRREGVRGHDVFFCPRCQPATRRHFFDRGSAPGSHPPGGPRTAWMPLFTQPSGAPDRRSVIAIPDVTAYLRRPRPFINFRHAR
jgi:hypothetical protein